MSLSPGTRFGPYEVVAPLGAGGMGPPTLPTGVCTNGTLTFVALALRSADAIATTNAR